MTDEVQGRMGPEQALQTMSTIVTEIQQKIAEAKRHADQYGLMFTLPVAGLDYYGTSWESSDEWQSSYSGRWMSSSDYC